MSITEGLTELDKALTHHPPAVVGRVRFKCVRHAHIYTSWVEMSLEGHMTFECPLCGRKYTQTAFGFEFAGKKATIEKIEFSQLKLREYFQSRTS